MPTTEKVKHVKEAAHRGVTLLEEAKEKISDLASDAVDRSEELLSKAKDQSEDLWNEVQDKGENAWKDVKSVIRKNPALSLGCAFAAGALVVALLTRSEE